MNTNNKIRSTRNLIVFGFIVMLGIGVITTVLLAQRKTNQRSKAAASTTLAFSPASQNTNVGQTVTADLTLDPGQNQVSILKLVINYDGSVFDQSTATIIPNLITQSSPSSQGFVQILQPFTNTCNGTSCQMSVTESIGSQANLVITQPLKAASVSLKAIAQTGSSGSSVTIDQSSAAYSLAPSDQTNENVIAFSSLSPLTISVGAGNGGGGSPTPTPPSACIPNQETCSWDALSGAVSYNYTITDQTTGGVVSQGSIPASQTSVQFNATIGDTYQCSVTAINVCQASGSTTSVTNTCPVGVSPTPTPSPTPTNTPTPTPTPLASCNASCSQNSNCQSGLICNNGACVNPACTSQSNCQCPQPTTPPPPTQIIYVTQPPQVVYVTQPPQIIVVTQPPVVQKVLPPTGPGDILVRIGEVGAAIAIIGGLAAATGL